MIPITLIVIVGLVASLVTAVAIARNRRERRTLAESVRALGLEYLPKPTDKDFLKDWSAAVPELAESGKVEHVLFGLFRGTANVEPAPVTALRHEHVVSTGSSPIVITTWVFSADAPAWPGVCLKPRNALARRLLAPRELTGEHEFDRAWRLASGDRAFAQAMLKHPVRTVLMEQLTDPARRWRPAAWRVAQDKVCLVVRSKMNADQVRTALLDVTSVRRGVAGDETEPTTPHP